MNIRMLFWGVGVTNFLAASLAEHENGLKMPKVENICENHHSVQYEKKTSSAKRHVEKKSMWSTLEQCPTLELIQKIRRGCELISICYI